MRSSDVRWSAPSVREGEGWVGGVGVTYIITYKLGEATSGQVRSGQVK